MSSRPNLCEYSLDCCAWLRRSGPNAERHTVRTAKAPRSLKIVVAQAATRWPERRQQFLKAAARTTWSAGSVIGVWRSSRVLALAAGKEQKGQQQHPQRC